MTPQEIAAGLSEELSQVVRDEHGPFAQVRGRHIPILVSLGLAKRVGWNTWNWTPLGREVARCLEKSE
jgi:hypothetical protein